MFEIPSIYTKITSICNATAKHYAFPIQTIALIQQVRSKESNGSDQISRKRKGTIDQTAHTRPRETWEIMTPIHKPSMHLLIAWTRGRVRQNICLFKSHRSTRKSWEPRSVLTKRYWQAQLLWPQTNTRSSLQRAQWAATPPETNVGEKKRIFLKRRPSWVKNHGRTSFRAQVQPREHIYADTKKDPREHEEPRESQFREHKRRFSRIQSCERKDWKNLANISFASTNKDSHEHKLANRKCESPAKSKASSTNGLTLSHHSYAQEQRLEGALVPDWAKSWPSVEHSPISQHVEDDPVRPILLSWLQSKHLSHAPYFVVDTWQSDPIHFPNYGTAIRTIGTSTAYRHFHVEVVAVILSGLFYAAH
jgi:hypothetical protein